ncbi:MAG: hypothetical protein ACYC35_00245 [Pirellulales bacterium]
MTDKSYAQKAVEAVRGIPNNARRVYLWEFPEADLAAHQALPDTPRMKTYGDYLAAIAALQADLERRGSIVVRVKFSVATMLAELQERGWLNDVKHRAGVTGELGAKQ